MGRLENSMDGFIEFVRKQGVVGMAVGLAVGASVATFVGDLVEGLISPIIGAVTGGEQGLAELSTTVGDVEMNYGKALASFIAFISTALVVYLLVKLIGADKWDAE